MGVIYKMATDKDFEKWSEDFRYIGEEAFIELPHIIQGKKICNYNLMFYNNKVVRGVKSTNEKINSVKAMFMGAKVPFLDISELDMSRVKNASRMFSTAEITDIIWPSVDKIKPTNISLLFLNAHIDDIRLTNWDLSQTKIFDDVLDGARFNNIKLPASGLDKLLMATTHYSPLSLIPAHSQTEDICWAAVSQIKSEAKYVKIKSKKILMYLGAECPEYAKFYYDEEN